MFTRALRMILAATTLALIPGSPVGRGADAASCAAPANVSALADGPGGMLPAGTTGNGLYRSADRGHCWSQLTSFPPGVEIGTLLAPPDQPSVLIAGGSFVVSAKARSWAVYRSADGGATWTAARADCRTRRSCPFSWRSRRTLP